MKSEDLEQAKPKSFTFSKNERLRNKAAIKSLFSSKSSDFVFPFKYIHQPSQELSCHQILVSVPKKQFKRSVDRHLLIRRIKEAYRLHKHIISTNAPTYIVYIYVAKEILSFKEIEKKLSLILQKINKHSNENTF